MLGPPMKAFRGYRFLGLAPSSTELNIGAEKIADTIFGGSLL